METGLWSGYLGTGDRKDRKQTSLTPVVTAPLLDSTKWPDFLANPALTKPLLSRLRERCHTIITDGPCIRAQSG